MGKKNGKKKKKKRLESAVAVKRPPRKSGSSEKQLVVTRVRRHVALYIDLAPRRKWIVRPHVVLYQEIAPGWLCALKGEYAGTCLDISVVVLVY
jgi:hypothetical protein